MQGQAARPKDRAPAPPDPAPEDLRGPKVNGEFWPGDDVRIVNSASRLYHVVRIDEEREPRPIMIVADCGCGGPSWVNAEMLMHNTFS